jgi:hypothetical protein
MKGNLYKLEKSLVLKCRSRYKSYKLTNKVILITLLNLINQLKNLNEISLNEKIKKKLCLIVLLIKINSSKLKFPSNIIKLALFSNKYMGRGIIKSKKRKYIGYNYYENNLNKCFYDTSLDVNEFEILFDKLEDSIDNSFTMLTKKNLLYFVLL